MPSHCHYLPVSLMSWPLESPLFFYLRLQLTQLCSQFFFQHLDPFCGSDLINFIHGLQLLIFWSLKKKKEQFGRNSEEKDGKMETAQTELSKKNSEKWEQFKGSSMKTTSIPTFSLARSQNEERVKGWKYIWWNYGWKLQIWWRKEIFKYRKHKESQTRWT